MRFRAFHSDGTAELHVPELLADSRLPTVEKVCTLLRVLDHGRTHGMAPDDESILLGFIDHLRAGDVRYSYISDDTDDTLLMTELGGHICIGF